MEIQFHASAINGSCAYLAGNAGSGVRYAVIINGWPKLAEADAALSRLLSGGSAVAVYLCVR